MDLGQHVLIKKNNTTGIIVGFDEHTYADGYKYVVKGYDGQSARHNLKEVRGLVPDVILLGGLADDDLLIWASDDELHPINITIPDNRNQKETYVRRFKSGAVRSDDRGREKPSFVSPYAIKFLAEHFSKNASFFNGADSAKNYFKGIEPIDIEDSLERHVLDFKFAMMPQNRNRDKIKKALTEIMANCAMGLHQIGLEEDGLYETPFEKTEYIKKED